MGCYMAVYVMARVQRSSTWSVTVACQVRPASRACRKQGGVRYLAQAWNHETSLRQCASAAHEDKVALRLANVAKIKAALKVDSFLPADDPRSKLDDITEQFDHTFWFGDLNFRIDISRQHADWLMMNKKYDQALAFDQLGKVLKEGDSFKGFKEAPIHFPPTYKYDVLKTLKIKAQQTLTSIRNGVDIPGAGAVASGKTAGSELSHTHLGESVIPRKAIAGSDLDENKAGDASLSYAAPGEPDCGTSLTSDAAFCALPARGVPPNSSEGQGELAENAEADRSDEDRYSIASSSAFGSLGSSSGFAQSYQTREARLAQDADPALVRERELELQRQRQAGREHQCSTRPSLLLARAAIKAKFKLMDMVRSATNTNLKEKLGNAISSEGQHGNDGKVRKKWLHALTDQSKRGACQHQPQVTTIRS